MLNEALAEGLVLAERAGIAREDAYEVVASGAVAEPYVLYERMHSYVPTRLRSRSRSS